MPAPQPTPSIKEQVKLECQARFGEPTFLVRAPGRVNLIGEHTDYNEGFVLPIAIDREVYLAARPKEGSRCHLYSLTLQQAAEFDLEDLAPERVEPWARYAAGVAWALQQQLGACLTGWAVVVGSTLPMGAGLSSSAALEAAFALLWNQLDNLGLDRWSLARACQRAENEFVGVQCGIMDQVASLLSRAGHALFLDTRSFETRAIPLPADLVPVIADTGKKRALGESEYNRRREECEQAVRLLAEWLGGAGRSEVAPSTVQRNAPQPIRALRDLSTSTFALFAPLLPDPVRKRARHVVSENERVLAFLQALQAADRQQLGLLMRASHASLRDEYEVSCPELDAMAEACWAAPGCIGARLTGAGFGGACVALVESHQIETFLQTAELTYRRSTDYEPTFYACRAVEGATIEEITR